MTVLAFKVFAGEVPRLPETLLPENAARLAVNADFAHGELRMLRGGFEVEPAVTCNGALLRSVWTENGKDFFGWPYDVYAVKSQVVDDVHNRVYYTAMMDAGPLAKVCRTKRDTGFAVINNPATGCPNYYPPEYHTAAFHGLDSWVLGVPTPRVMADVVEDNLAVELADKKDWPGMPALGLRVTLIYEDQNGAQVFEKDMTNTERAPGTRNVIYTTNPGDRGILTEDMMWSLANTTNPALRAPYKFYFFIPPTIAEINEASGGEYTMDQLRATVRVVGYDPDANGRTVFTVNSSNSSRTGANETSGVPGGLWVDMFDFAGDSSTNPIIKMWEDAGFEPDDWSTDWIGFRFGYGISEARTYTLTWVNDFLEESVPCPPSEIGVTHMHYPRLWGRFRPPGYIVHNSLPNDGVRHYFVPIRHFRLYRTNVTQSGSAIYQRVPVEAIGRVATAQEATDFGNDYATLPSEQAFPHDIPTDDPRVWGYEIRDDVENDRLLEALQSTDWSQPPYTKMRGLTAWRNGMMAAYEGNNLMFCEPYRPFAWPRKYWIPLPDEIIGLAVHGNALIALTRGQPYLFAGAHPAGVSYEPLENAPPGLPTTRGDPCKAVVSTPGGVIYGSADGLWMIAGGRAQPLAGALFTAEEWRLRYRAGFGSMRLIYADASLLSYFPDDLIFGFKMALAEAGSSLTQWHPGRASGSYQTPTLHYISPDTGRLYLAFAFPAPYPPVSGPTVRVWVAIHRAFDEQAARFAGQYWTREMMLAKPESLSAWEIRGHGGSVTLSFYDDRSQATPFHTQAVSLDDFATRGIVSGRLPKGYKARNYSVRLQVSDNAVVRELYLASVPQELERV